MLQNGSLCRTNGGKIFHVNKTKMLRVECTLFCYLQSRARTHAVLLLNRGDLLSEFNCILYWSNGYHKITVTDNSFSSLSTDLHTTSAIDSSCHSTTSLGSPMASSSPNRITKHNDPLIGV
jgi:hypothetical protein